MRLKHPVIKTLCIAAIIAAVLAYNLVHIYRQQNEELSLMQAKVSAMSDFIDQLNASAGNTAQASDSPGPYKDGVYIGTSDGYGGDVTMEVTIENGYITEIETKDCKGEDAAYWTMTESIIPKIKEKQSNDVDTVSGATFSSAGLINAVTRDLVQAV